MTELQALQNASTGLSLTVHEKYTQDKRKTVGRYFLTDRNGTTVSPVLDYEQMNHFILGWSRALKHARP